MRTYNSILRYSVPSGIVELDPETGNYKQLNKNIDIKAFLRQNVLEASAVRTPQDEYYGVNVNALPMVGRLINPPTLPDFIEPYSEALAKIDNYYGKFYLTPYVQSELISIVSHRVIKGWFVIDNSSYFQ